MSDADTPAKYEVGAMNCDAQRATFNAFCKATAYITVALLLLLVFLLIFRT